MQFWLVIFWGMLGVAMGGELGGSDSWLLMVEAGRDGPQRRITPKSVFIAPALASRTERCRQGFRYDHLGNCVKVVRVKPQAQLDLLLKRLQGAQSLKPAAAKLPQPLPVSGGPLHFSLSLGVVDPPAASTVTQVISTSTSSSSTTARTTSTTSSTSSTSATVTDPSPPPLVAAASNFVNVTDSSISPPASQEATRSPSISEVSSTTETITKEKEVTLNSSKEETQTEKIPINETFSDSTEGSTFRVPFEGSGDTTVFSLEGSGETGEVSGTSSTVLEGSGWVAPTLAVATPTAIPEEERPPRSTTITSEEEVTEPPDQDLVSANPTSCCEDSTPIPPTDTTASLLLAMLKGVEVWKTHEIPKIEEDVDIKNDTSAELVAENAIISNSTEKETSLETTTTRTNSRDEGITEQLPIIEYIDLELPKNDQNYSESADVGNKVLIPLENINWNFSETPNATETTTEASGDKPTKIQVPILGNTKTENVIVEGLKYDLPEKTHVEEFIPTTERNIFENSGFDTQENKVVTESWWIETVPYSSSWVRFPENAPPPPPLPIFHRRKGSNNPSDTRSHQNSKFRFPEEVVDPEHRPVLLKFWSRIPMFQQEDSDQKPYQSDEEHWIAP